MYKCWTYGWGWLQAWLWLPEKVRFPYQIPMLFQKTPQTPPYLQCLRTPWFFATTLMSPRNMRSARTRVKRSSSQRCQPLWWKKVPRRIGKMRCLRKVSYPKIFFPKKNNLHLVIPKKKKHLALALWNFFVGYFLEAIWLFQLWCPPKLWEAAIPHHPWFVVVFFMARATLILIVFLSPPKKNPSSLGSSWRKQATTPPPPKKKSPCCLVVYSFTLPKTNSSPPENRLGHIESSLPTINLQVQTLATSATWDPQLTILPIDHRAPP